METWSIVLLNLMHAGFLVVIISECSFHLNDMNRKTGHAIRAAYIFLASGASILLLQSVHFTSQPNGPDMLMGGALAFFLIASRHSLTDVRHTDNQRSKANVHG